MLTDLVPLGEVIAFGLGLTTAGAALIIQCADKRNAPKKGGAVAKKSTRSQHSSKLAPVKSQRSSKRAPVKSQRSSEADPVQKSQRSAKSTKSKRSLRSQKKQRVSNRSGSKRSDRKSAVGVPNVQTGLEQKAAASKRDAAEDLSLNSLQETRRSEARQLAAQKQTQPTLEVTQTGNVPRLEVEPRELHFSQEGGLLKVQLHNPSTVRQAVKIKCSDNNLYRVNPVYGYVEPGQQLDVEVVRQGGNAKLDKLVFVTTRATNSNADLKKLFKEAPREEQPMVVLPLWA